MTDPEVTAPEMQHTGGPLIMIVPGLAVRSYVQPEADALRTAGHRVDLLPAPAWRDRPADLRRYGQELAEQIDSSGTAVDLLIGLSAGTQAAAVAARSRLVRRLLLVGPTMDPDHRTPLRAIRSWMAGENHPDSPRLTRQARDWMKAGAPRLYRGLMSTIAVALEDVLPQVRADTMIVHSDSDVISPMDYALELATQNGARFLVMPDAPHSWPIGDPARFIELVDELLGDG